MGEAQTQQAGGGGGVLGSAGCEAEDAADAIVERIAEAVVRKIDERDKINLLADAVIARLQELGQTPGDSAGAVPLGESHREEEPV